MVSDLVGAFGTAPERPARGLSPVTLNSHSLRITPGMRRPNLITQAWRPDGRHTEQLEEIHAENAGENSQRRQGECSAETATGELRSSRGAPQGIPGAQISRRLTASGPF